VDGSANCCAARTDLLLDTKAHGNHARLVGHSGEQLGVQERDGTNTLALVGSNMFITPAGSRRLPSRAIGGVHVHALNMLAYTRSCRDARHTWHRWHHSAFGMYEWSHGVPESIPKARIAGSLSHAVLSGPRADSEPSEIWTSS